MNIFTYHPFRALLTYFIILIRAMIHFFIIFDNNFLLINVRFYH